MSLFDKLKEASKKAGEQIQKEAKKKLDLFKLKQQARKLLDDLNKRDLIDYCIQNDIPASTKMDKDDIIGSILNDSDFSLEAIQDYHDEVMKGLKSIKFARSEEIEMEQEIVRTEKIKTRVKKTTRTITKLRKTIKEFNPIITKKSKERDIEAQMVQVLSAILGKGKVTYQERARGGRVDIVVDTKYAIELKIINTPSQLTALIGQALVYSKEYEKVFVWMYDKRSQLKTADVNKFKKHLKDAGISNVEVVVSR